MKISQKLYKELNQVIDNSVQEMYKNETFFDQKKINSAPEMWDEDTKKLFDILSELTHKIKIGIDECIL